MTFTFPWVLWLLPLSLLFLRKWKWKAIEVSSLCGWLGTAEPLRVRWLIVLRIFRALSFTLLVISIAGPRTERPVNEEIRQGVALAMLVDISSSMEKKIKGHDGKETSRMEATKKTVEAFIENRPDDLIGLITFARYADTLSPLTFGHRALIQLVREINIQDRPNEDGTAYGDALSLACAHLSHINEWNEEDQKSILSQAVILLTDGQNNCGLHQPWESAGFAKKLGIRIYTISLGDRNEKELTNAENLLELISEATKGGFWKIYDAEELSETYERIDELETSEIKNATRVHTEYALIFPVFALPALILLFVECLLISTVLRIAEEEA